MNIFSLQKSRTFKIKLKTSLTIISLPGGSHLLSPRLINTIHLTVYHSDFVCVCVYVCVFHHTHTHTKLNGYWWFVITLISCISDFSFFFFFLAKNMYYLGNLENTCFKFHSFKYPEVVSPGISFYALVEKPSMPGFFSQTWDEKILLPWLLGDMTPSPAEYHAQYLSTGDGACYFFIHFWKLSPRNAL